MKLMAYFGHSVNWVLTKVIFERAFFIYDILFAVQPVVGVFTTASKTQKPQDFRLKANGSKSDPNRIRTYDLQIRKSTAYLENTLYLVYSEQFTNIFFIIQIFCTIIVPPVSVGYLYVSTHVKFEK